MFNWYYIFNTDSFDALNLVSRKLSLVLGDLGQKEFLITKGNYHSITFDDVMLVINLNARNPFEFENYAVYVDVSNNVYLGVAVT